MPRLSKCYSFLQGGLEDYKESLHWSGVPQLYKRMVLKGQSPRACGGSEPKLTALWVNDHVLLSCSQATVQSGKACPISERDISNGAETPRVKPHRLVGCVKSNPWVKDGSDVVGQSAAVRG